MIRFAAPALLLAILPLTAAAQDVDCAKAEAQVELTFCAEQDWNDADARLNDAYQRAMDVMKYVDSGLESADQGAAGSLRDAQRAWVAFRDANCAAEAWVYHGGSAEPMAIYACRARVSNDRADELENMAMAD